MKAFEVGLETSGAERIGKLEFYNNTILTLMRRTSLIQLNMKTSEKIMLSR